MKHDLGFDLMPRLRYVFGQIAAACSNLAVALRDGKDPSDVRISLRPPSVQQSHISCRNSARIAMSGCVAWPVSMRPLR